MDIRDKYGRLLARQSTVGNRIELRNHYNALLGYYDIKQDVTRDYIGRFIATGNVLGTLVPPFESQ